MPTLLDTSDLQFTRDVIPDPQELFTRLAAEIAWDASIVSRRVASFGRPYNYSGITWPEVPFPDDIRDMASRLQPYLKFVPDNCLVNYYPDGSGKMGFHSDDVANLAPGTGIAIVSLGAERPLVFRHIQDRTREETYSLSAGSLLVMSAELQQDWKHALPPVDGLTAGRISLTFRRIKAN